MIYNNILYFLAAIIIFSMAATPTAADLPGYLSVASFFLLIFIYDKLLGLNFKRSKNQQASAYFKAEKKAAILAMLCFGVMIFGLELKYYLSFIPLSEEIPSLVNIAGLTVFLGLFCLLWRRAHLSYEHVFARQNTQYQFVLSNLKANLPIVVPWVVLSFSYDLSKHLPWKWWQDFIATDIGDLLLIGTFLVVLLIFLPSIVKRMWGCKKLEEGVLRDHLMAFCRKQNITAEIYIWPLFQGRMITAAVVGVFPGLRYLLLTPALIETMTLEELEAVMAHEIGHIKRFHLKLYLLLLGVLVFFLDALFRPLIPLLKVSDFFYTIINLVGISPQEGEGWFYIIITLIVIVIYIRIIFAYFMRNFERQADLHVYPVLGNSNGIVSAFEKIAYLSGNIRDQPSWHHFGIGQRVDFLKKCDRFPVEIKNHHKKVYLSLVAFLMLSAAVIFSVRSIDNDHLSERGYEKFFRAILLYHSEKMNEPARWLTYQGEVWSKKKNEEQAIIAYDLAMEMEPMQPELLNNFSWLLLTSKKSELRNPTRALTMARTAANLLPRGHILDTLGVAFWANGFVEEAIKAEKQAIFADPENKEYYRSQIQRFRSLTYLEELEKTHPGLNLEEQLKAGEEGKG